MGLPLGNINPMGSNNMSFPERFDIRYQIFVLLFHAIETGIYSLGDKKYSAVRYKLVVDQLYLFVKLNSVNIEHQEKIDKLRKDLNEGIYKVADFSSTFEYTLKVQDYLELVLDSVRKTGMVRPGEISLVGGQGKLDDSKGEIIFPKAKIREDTED